MELDLKNLWMNLTIVLPGMVTYGMWRIVILLIGYEGIEFENIDKSTVLSLCVLFAIALIQQAIGISIEAALTLIFYKLRKRWKYAYLLFVERFSSLATETYNEDVMRTIGQFFLSLNLAVGQVLILVFLIFAKNPPCSKPVDKPVWLYIMIGGIILVALIVAIFRCWNAVKAIRPLEENKLSD